MPKMNLKLKTGEQEKFRRYTEKMSKENTEECNKLLVATAFSIERMAKRFAPVNFGFLRSTIRTKIERNAKGAVIYVNKLYAAYQEFGTGSKVTIPTDVADYAATFKGAGKRKVNMRAQPFLFPAFRIGRARMMAKLEDMGFKKI